MNHQQLVANHSQQRGAIGTGHHHLVYGTNRGASGAFSAGVVPNNTQCKGVDPASAEGYKKQLGVRVLNKQRAGAPSLELFATSFLIAMVLNATKLREIRLKWLTGMGSSSDRPQRLGHSFS